MDLKWMSVMGLIGASLVAFECVGAEIDSPPVVGDRTAQFSWQPDADDPLFNGNSVLELEYTLPFTHSPGNPVRDFVTLAGSLDLFSYAVGETSIKRWSREDGEVTAEFHKSTSDELIAISLHGAGSLLGGALGNGEVELWETDSPETSRLFRVSDDPLLGFQFFPGTSDPSNLRFVATADSFAYVMDSPELRRFKIRSVAGPMLAFTLSLDAQNLIGGAEDGTIRAWDLTRNPEETGPYISNRNNPHPGPVRQIVISRDGERMVSVDKTGHVRLSVVGRSEFEVVSSFDVPTEGNGPRVSFSVPTGSVIVVAREDGVVELRDGSTGALLREALFSEDGLSAVAATPDGQRTIFGTRNGEIIVARAELCTPSVQNPVCFGGYKIWRNIRAVEEGAVLLRSFSFSDSTWSFVDGVRSFQDPDSIILRVGPPEPGQTPPPPIESVAGPHNGMPYFYSLTRFDRVFSNGSVFDVLATSIVDGYYRDAGEVEPTPIVSQSRGRMDLPLLSRVVPVPNPYLAGQVPWDVVSGQHIEFRNLPETATIRIFTVAGDIVRVLEHGLGSYGESRSALVWDLKNSQGRQVASGVYPYQVETESGETIQGFCTIVL